jgi:CDP-diacylglycerol---glycerol-3-phosphate 3-phosphatidyltransferase
MTVEGSLEKKPETTLTDLAREKFRGLLDPVGRFLNRMGLTPNAVTLAGLVGNTIGAVLLGQGNMLAGGILVVLMGPIDALDGTMARLRGEPTEFGAFIDSVTDRYSEVVIFGGLLIHYLQQGNLVMSAAVYAAAAGSLLVSYVRARGQSLQMDTKVGLLTRLERYMVLAPSLIFNIPAVGIWIIAVLANLTAFQRILDVRRQAHIRIKSSSSIH